MDADYLNQRLQQARIKQLQSSNKGLSVTQMARNLGNSIVKNVVSVVQGNELKLSDSETQNRLDICRQCPYFESGSQRCGKCGCYLAVKTYLKAEKCPIGKW